MKRLLPDFANRDLKTDVRFYRMTSDRHCWRQYKRDTDHQEETKSTEPTTKTTKRVKKMAGSNNGNGSSSTSCKIFPDHNDVVWVNKRYIPIDLRSTAPVPRCKFINPSQFPPVPDAWKHSVHLPIQHYSRHLEERKFYPSSPSTRCEEWSTLRQMLPSKGRPLKQLPPRWGTNPSTPIDFVKQSNDARHPHINSPMTKYVDELHVTNRLFKFYWQFLVDCVRREEKILIKSVIMYFHFV